MLEKMDKIGRGRVQMGKVSYRPKKNQGKQDLKKQYVSKVEVEETELDKVEEKANETAERISVINNQHKNNTEKLESIKVVGDMECAYHIYIEDYVYTYIYQLASADLAKESAAILIGEIYSDSKEAIIRGIIPINEDKLSEGAEWIDIGVAQEIDKQRQEYFSDQDIIGWMHMQPGYGTMMTMKELREHQSVFEGDGTICMLVDAINKIETLYVYEDEELKEQSGYCMYYERNEQMQQYMLDHPLAAGTKEEMKDTVVNQFREIGKIRKAEYTQRKNLNLTVVAASIILIALTAVIVKMNDNKVYNEAAQMANGILSPIEDEVQSELFTPTDVIDETLSQNNTDAVGQEEMVENSVNTEEITQNPEEAQSVDEIQGAEGNEEVSEGETLQSEEVMVNEEADTAEYDIYVVQQGDTLADICYKEYGNAKRSLEVAKFNGLTDTNQIYIGQELKMPK